VVEYWEGLEGQCLKVMKSSEGSKGEIFMVKEVMAYEGWCLLVFLFAAVLAHKQRAELSASYLQSSPSNRLYLSGYLKSRESNFRLAYMPSSFSFVPIYLDPAKLCAASHSLGNSLSNGHDDIVGAGLCCLLGDSDPCDIDLLKEIVGLNVAILLDESNLLIQCIRLYAVLPRKWHTRSFP